MPVGSRPEQRSRPEQGSQEPSPADAERLLALARQSVEVIRANQAPSGAYLASPNFPVYRYCWLRDGAFIADAMSRAGQIASAEAFFGWCNRVLVTRRERVEALIARRRAGEAIDPTEFLPARYTTEGEESGEAWTDFQLDGYGAWLWALDAHRRRYGRRIADFLPGVAPSADYIAAFWDHPSYDWWEEHPDHRHTSTLAALYAGLAAVARWPELSAASRDTYAAAANAIRAAIRSVARRLGHLPKWLGSDAVDASLIAIATPFRLLAPDDAVVARTVRQIEAQLVHAGGVHRYTDDSYYGGGEWLLLAALLGWHYAEVGRTADARVELAWVAAHATPDGELPEQVPGHLLAPEHFAEWERRWGPIATPLLWSHAMFLTLALTLGAVPAGALRARGVATGDPERGGGRGLSSPRGDDASEGQRSG